MNRKIRQKDFIFVANCCCIVFIFWQTSDRPPEFAEAIATHIRNCRCVAYSWSTEKGTHIKRIFPFLCLSLPSIPLSIVIFPYIKWWESKGSNIRHISNSPLITFSSVINQISRAGVYGVDVIAIKLSAPDQCKWILDYKRQYPVSFGRCLEICILLHL